MPIAAKDQLFKLVKTLTKAEKRSFRLYANRTMGDQDRKFMALFDQLDKMEAYDEPRLLKRLPGKTTKSQLSNQKRHLYKLLLTSLRLTNIQKHIDIQIREQLDFARILYSKGLYMESLRLLERIKQTANERHQDILHLEIIEFQKLSEARHVTRSRQIDRKMDRLLEESAIRSRVTRRASEFANLNIQVHGYYILYGHVQTDEDRQQAMTAWRLMQPELPNQGFADTFFEKVNRYQAYMWFRYILLELETAREHAYEWVNLFHLHPQMRAKDPDLYMRGLYYLLTFLYLTEDLPTYQRYLADLKVFIDKYLEQFNTNSRNIGFVYYHLSHLNLSLLQRRYEDGYNYVKRILKQLPRHEDHIDPHRLMLFYYKFAAIAFTLGKYDEALGHLHHILNFREHILRKEMEINARLLQLLCFYCSEDLQVLEYRLTSLNRSLSKSKVAGPIQRQSISMLRELLKATPDNRSTILTSYKQVFEQLEQEAKGRKNLKYLDIPTWIEAQLQKITVAELYQTPAQR